MRKDIMLILLILAILALIIVPLGPTMLDILLSINLTLAVLLLIVSVYLKHPADFPTFPAVILLGTAFRLALSIATTRQILTEAQAGQIIETFGSFVIAGNIAVGLIVFLIITVFQFLVVTKGAERVAEVSARFALDAMPGKQMSIDADLRAENIDKATAAERRSKLERESQFFGSMDGAMKFVKGDAIAGLIIIFINLIGGISVGMLILGFSFGDAVETFTLLTLGDGLVAQLPALLMALCAGIVTTRIEGQNNIDLGTDIWRDLVTDPRVPAAAAGIVILIGLIPGFPLLNFAVAAGALLIVSFSMRRLLAESAEEEDRSVQGDAGSAVQADDPSGADVEDPHAMQRRPASTRFVIRVGGSLYAQLNVEEVDALLGTALDRYESSRGVSFDQPPIIEEPTMGTSFSVELDNVPLLTENVPVGMSLFLLDRSSLRSIGCDPKSAIRSKWHEVEAHWVPDSFSQDAMRANLSPLPVERYIAMIAFRLIEAHVGILFSEQHFQAFLERSRRENPDRQEALDNRVDRMEFFQTLRYLAEDGVPLKPAGLITDTFLTWLHSEGNVGALRFAEYMRGSLKRQVCHALSDGRGILGVVLLDPGVEQAAMNAINRSTETTSPAAADGIPFEGKFSDSIIAQFRGLIQNMSPDEVSPVVLTNATLRRRMRNFLSANRIALPVMAPHELSQEINAHPIARIEMPLSA